MFNVNASEFTAQVSRLTRRDGDIATTWALNDTASDVLKHIQDRMRIVFDNPTRFTAGDGGNNTGAFTIKGASPRNLEATVWEKPSVSKKHYLKVQESGGPRPQTGVERLLNTRMAYEGNIRSVVPAAGALLDGHGNWKASERNRVLSSVRAQSDRMMNSTKVSKVKSRSAKQFFVPRLDSKLSPGVWRRTSKRAKLQKVLHFSDKVPTYAPRLGFYDGAEKVYEDRLPIHITRTFEAMWLKRQG